MKIGIKSSVKPEPKKIKIVVTNESIEELERSAEDFSDHVDTVINLAGIRDNIESYGLSEPVIDLIDENKQLTNFLGVEVKPGNEALVLDAFDNKFTTDTQISVEAMDAEGDAKVNRLRKTWWSFIRWAIAYVIFVILRSMSFVLFPIAYPVIKVATFIVSVIMTIKYILLIVRTIRVLIHIPKAKPSPAEPDAAPATEALGSDKKITGISKSDFVKQIKSLKAATTLISRDSKSSFEKAKVEDYDRAVGSVGFTADAKGRYQFNNPVKPKQGSLAELGWTANDINKAVDLYKADEKMLSSLAASLNAMKDSTTKKLKDLKVKVDAEAAKAAKDPKSAKATPADKAKLRADLQKSKDDGVKMGNAVKSIISAYQTLLNQFAVINKAASK